MSHQHLQYSLPVSLTSSLVKITSTTMPNLQMKIIILNKNHLITLKSIQYRNRISKKYESNNMSNNYKNNQTFIKIKSNIIPKFHISTIKGRISKIKVELILFNNKNKSNMMGNNKNKSNPTCSYKTKAITVLLSATRALSNTVSMSPISNKSSTKNLLINSSSIQTSSISIIKTHLFFIILSSKSLLISFILILTKIQK